MPYGSSPYTTDKIDVLLKRRLGLKRGLPAAVEEALNTASPEAEYRANYVSPMRQAAAEAMGPIGQDSLAAGIAAGGQAQNFGGGLLQGLAASLATGNAGRREAAATKAASDLEAKKLGLEERRVAADELRASREPNFNATQTVAQKFKDEGDFLRSIGYDDKKIQEYFMRKGHTGAGGTGRLTDLDKIADGLVKTGRAPDMPTAYVMARTILQQSQVVGSIEKSVMDEDLNETVQRVNVYRRQNPITGQYEMMDASGALLTPQDYHTFLATPQIYAGGTGGPANPAPTPPGPAQGQAPQPAAPVAPMAPVASHAITPGLQAQPVGDQQTQSNTDFVPGQGGFNEQQIMDLLSDPRMQKDTLRAYASGRGPAGNSTLIKMLAAKRLRNE